DGPHHAHSMPRATPALSISVRVSSTGGLASDHTPGRQRRKESKTGLLIQSEFGCCIQASMIMRRPSRGSWRPMMHPETLSANGTKPTSISVAILVAFRGIADIALQAGIGRK